MRFVCALGAVLFELTVGSGWAAWKNATPIAVPAKLTDSYVRVTLEPDFDPTPDLRVLDESGTESPYVTDPDAHRNRGGTQREIPIAHAEFVPGAYTQVVLDFGGISGPHSAVLLDGGGEAFFDRVRVEAGSDAKGWTLLRKDAYIYRSPADKNGNMIVSFEPTQAPQVRLQILDSNAKFPLTGWSVSEPPPERGDTFIARPQTFADSSPSNDPSKQRWTADFGRPVAASAIEFLNPTSGFRRPVLVEAGPTGTAWHDVATGTIANASSGAPQTAFAFPEERARFWRVTIDNGRHPGIGNLIPRLMTHPHDLLFEPALNRTYVLLSGNDAASPPSYDLAAKLQGENWTAALATLGPTQVNPAFENARPIMERYPLAVYAAAALGVAGLGVLLLRIVRPRPRPKDVFEPPPKNTPQAPPK